MQYTYMKQARLAFRITFLSEKHAKSKKKFFGAKRHFFEHLSALFETELGLAKKIHKF